MSLRVLTLVALSTLLSACGVSRHCVGEFPYQSAETLPTPTEVDGMKMQDSVSALRIPPAPPETVPYAREFPDPANPGKTRVDCLDVPPPLKLTPEPVEAPEPAEAPVPTEPAPAAEES